MKKWVALMLIVVSMLAMSGCGSKWQDGTYSASSVGKNGDVEVTVTIAEGRMTDIVVGENEETETVGGVAISTLPVQMIDEQTWDIDGVSGATMTSEALRTAVAACLKQAEGE